VCAHRGVDLEQELNDFVIRPKQWYRYHHHRFYPESRFTCLPAVDRKTGCPVATEF
jgi:hypothetical protein